MRATEYFLQGVLFAITSLALLFSLSIAVHFPIGRLLFAVLVAGICLCAECFALFKLLRLLFRWSSKAAVVILRSRHREDPAQGLLTETRN
jgi:hypothetical protein